MTQEEKAKAYDMAIERAKRMFSEKELNYLFPELKESEDERIRKVLIGWINLEPSISFGDTFDGFSKEQILAWLEKQGDYSKLVGEMKKRKELLSKEKENATSDNDKLSLGGRIAMLEELLVFSNEKQGEPVEITSEFDSRLNKLLKQFETLPKEELISSLSFYLNIVQNNGTYKSDEKQGQMIDNKVEPKFKVGDYVVDNCGYVWRIEGIINQFYILEGIDGGESRPTIEWVNKTFHLWTIQDAKEGDVLVDSLGNVCIYQEPSTKLMYHSYCYGNHKYFICMGGFHEIIGSYPATKEQRDQFKKVMTDTGYTFDFDKKELKEIEQKPADEVEPKFHKGDWVIDKQGIVHQVANVVENATNHTYGYDIVGGGYFNDNAEGVRLWNISDAKDGDILHSTWFHNDCIFIFNGLDNWKFDEPNGDRAVATGYCCLSVSADNMEFGMQGPDCVEVNTVKPATKIQRDTLERVMTNAGYRWNKEELKLEKI